MLGNSLVAAQLAASQEGLISMKLVISITFHMEDFIQNQFVRMQVII
jgi:hypothetical protein